MMMLDFDDVLIKPMPSTVSSRKNVDLSFSYFGGDNRTPITGEAPIIAAGMDHTGTIEMAVALEKLGIHTVLHKFYDKKTLMDFWLTYPSCAWYGMGMTQADLEKFNKINRNVFIPRVCIDVANGYTQDFRDFVKRFRDKNLETYIMAGNVATAEGTMNLIEAGADIVKVGIGPGSVCITRKVTGVGIPQLSAIQNCSSAAHAAGKLICGDGGCRYPGDVAKALVGGANLVMLGGMLAGHDECAGTVSLSESMEYYGMASKEAHDLYYNGVDDYKTPEGKKVSVPYKGQVKDTIREILGGLRSTCAYTNSHTILDLQKNGKFVRVSNTHNKIYGD